MSGVTIIGVDLAKRVLLPSTLMLPEPLSRVAILKNTPAFKKINEELSFL